MALRPGGHRRPLGEVIDHILACLARDYNDPDNAGMVYETAEGGYQGTVWDAHDFLQDELALELPNDDDSSLFDAICNGFGSQLWCTRHLYALGPEEVLAYSWETFCKLVKHESRFFFTRARARPTTGNSCRPTISSELIAEDAVAVGLARTMSAGQIYFRARYQRPGETLRHPSELGPPTPRSPSKTA